MPKDSGFRIFLSHGESLRPKKVVTLPEDKEHHLRRVARLKPEELFSVVYPEARLAFTAKLASSGAELVDSIPFTPATSAVTTLIVPALQSDRTELLVEKCTELGVGKFILTDFERSVRKAKTSSIIEKLKKVAEQAAQQSKQFFLPNFTYASDLQTALTALQGEGKLLWCALRPESLGIQTVTDDPAGFSVVIGPEGDFSDAEIACLIKARACPITLGPNVLRTETAAVAMVSQCNARFGYRVG